ncbi:hypothetical protein EYF80_060698 [Liparis tanakae]|uniref:Uncharacterized protein n=1 Tax=Liparis tanakae TaxID=230148 RepID=A0A4Z2EK72_9TELE|nr:hypothetical protein EYF80_060698 [Liparis tanakae]
MEEVFIGRRDKREALKPELGGGDNERHEARFVFDGRRSPEDLRRASGNTQEEEEKEEEEEEEDGGTLIHGCGG